MALLWVPLLILVQPRLVAPEDGAKSVVGAQLGGGLRSEGMASIGSPEELSPGGPGSQGCHLSTSCSFL